MKRTIEIPDDLDAKIQDLHNQWREYARTTYAETVRVLLTLGLDAIENRPPLDTKNPPTKDSDLDRGTNEKLINCY